MDDEYIEPADIRKFCRTLQEAWELVPDAQFGELLNTMLNGYSLDELSAEEMIEMMNDYILQNS